MPENDKILERLEQIEMHLKHLDSRDRLRMIGSTIRSLIGFGLLLFAIWSSVYLLQNLEEIMKTVAREAAKQTMEYSKEGSKDLMQQMQEMFKK